jgi:hypothetical protein
MSALSHEQLIENCLMYKTLAVHTLQFLRDTKIVQRDLNKLLSYKTSVVQ